MNPGAACFLCRSTSPTGHKLPVMDTRRMQTLAEGGGRYASTVPGLVYSTERKGNRSWLVIRHEPSGKQVVKLGPVKSVGEVVAMANQMLAASEWDLPADSMDLPSAARLTLKLHQAVRDQLGHLSA